MHFLPNPPKTFNNMVNHRQKCETWTLAASSILCSSLFLFVEYLGSSAWKMDKPIYYTKCLEAYIKNSTYVEESVKWIRQNIPRIVKNIIGAATIPEGERLRILSIGAGGGWTDTAILEEISKFKVPLHYTAVEPNVDLMKKFRMNVAQNSKYAEVEFELKEMGGEEFLSREATTQRYHLIFCLHSLYYFFARVREVLEDFYKLTEKNGCIVAIHLEKDRFNRKYEGKLPTANKAFSQDIDAALTNANLPFQRSKGQYTLDIGLIFDCGEEGNFLLDFLTYMPHFREASPQDRVKEVLEEINHAATKEGNKLVYPYVTGIHIIQKN